MEFSKSHIKLITLIIFLTLGLFVIKPFIITILLAAIIAYLFYPVHNKLKKNFGETISALIITLTIFVIGLISISYGINLILKEFTNFYLFISQLNLERFGPALKEFSQIITSKLINQISNQITTILHFIMSLAIFFVSIFYFLREGDSILIKITQTIPFEATRKKNIINEVKRNVDAFIHVQIVIGLIQGVIATIGLYLFGLPYPILAGIVAAILSILPIIGPYALYIPLAGLVYYTYGLNVAIGILLYGLIFASIMDYVLRPLFYGKKIRLHPMVTFLGVFGGLELFGIVGIIIGPILLSISISLLKELRVKK